METTVGLGVQDLRNGREIELAVLLSIIWIPHRDPCLRFLRTANQ